MADTDPRTRTRDELVNPQAVGRDRTEATIRRRAAQGTDLESEEIALSSDSESGEIRARITDAARREQVAEQSEQYSAEDLRVEGGGEVSVRERALKRQAAAESVYEPDELTVTDDGGVEPKTGPAPEATRVVLSDDDPRGDLTWVGPDGQRIETGAEASGEIYSAYVDKPDREGNWRLQVDGETVTTARVGPVGASRDAPQQDVARGWNGNIIELDEDAGTGSVTQDEYDPNERRTPASADEDVVAGAGAAEALQAGVEPETLSPVNPIDEGDGQAVADQLSQGDAQPEDRNLARRGSAVNRRLREQVASDRESVSADDVDLVQTSSGLRARIDAGARGVDPGDATEQAQAINVGDDPETLDRLDGDAERGVSITRPGGEGAVATGAPEPDRETDREGPNPSRREVGGASDNDLGDVGARVVRREPVPPEGGDIRLQNAARNQRPEQFGDIDWSIGRGGPEDEVEQFTDETVAGGVADSTRGLDRRIRRMQRRLAGSTGRPVGVPGVGIVGTSSPAQLGAEFAEDILGFVDDAGRAPGTALEAAEGTAYLTGQVDNSGVGEPGETPRIYSDPLTSTVVRGVSEFRESPDQSERRARFAGTVAQRAGRRAVDEVRENPQDVVTEAIAGAAVSGAAGSAFRAAGLSSRLGSTARAAGAVDVDVDAPDSGAGALGDTVSAVRDRSPSVSIRRDADASRLEIDPYLRQQLREAVPDLNGVARTAGRRSRTAEINAQLRTQNAASRTRAGLTRTADRLRGAPGRATAAVERTRRRVADAVDAEIDPADLAPSGAADTTTADVFGRPTLTRRLRAELQATREAVSELGAVDTGPSDLLPSGAADTATADVFGRPELTGRMWSGIQARREAIGGLRPTDALPSGAADTTTADVFGRPELTGRMWSGVQARREAIGGLRPIDADPSDLLPSGAADTTTADVFGRPRYPGAARAEFDSARDALREMRQSLTGRVQAARETTVRIGPIRPRRIDVGRAEDQPDTDLGPFADEELSDLPSWAEANDIDVDIDRTPTSDARRVGQAMRARMRTDQDTPTPTRSRGDVDTDLNGGLFAGVVAGVGTRAEDPVTGATNRDEVVTTPTTTDEVVTGTSVSEGLGPGADTDLGTGLGTDLDTGEGIGTTVDVTQTPDLGEDTDTGAPTRITTTPGIIPTEIPEPTPTTEVPDYPSRPPRVPDPEIEFGDSDGESEMPFELEEESDTFESGIVGNPFEETE